VAVPASIFGKEFGLGDRQEESVVSEGQPRICVGGIEIGEGEREYIGRVLDTGRLSYGPFMREFEQRFAAMQGAAHGIMSNSGTSALQLALHALKEIHGWSDGDEVVVPAVTFVATSNIVIHNRMKPVFIDVEREYYELDPALLESKITTRTRAIIPVHLFGLPCEMDPIRDVAARYDLKIIEDSCETMFARYRGEPVGSMGDIGCFSTYIAHLLVTGVGGLNTTSNHDYMVKIRSLLNHGRDPSYLSIDDDDDVSDQELQEIVARRFRFNSIGYSYRATELEAALGLAQLEKIEVAIQQRAANAARITDGLRDLEDRIQLPRIRPGCDHAFMMYPIVLRDEEKSRVVNGLEKRGVETREMLPLVNQPVYQRLFQIDVNDYPIADWINCNGFYVGCHQYLAPQDLDYLLEVLHEVISD
jgi:dTDP-4-amino-4,6-dideoxygalactose transaminase